MFVVKLYACNNFEWAGRSVFDTHTGRWAACDGCMGIIDSGDWNKLVPRVMRSVNKRIGLTQRDLNILRGELRILYLSLSIHLMPAEALTVQQPHYARLMG